MSSQTEDEWTVLKPIILPQANMENVFNDVFAKGEAPDREFTINTKPDASEQKCKEDCTCEAKPALRHKVSTESIEEETRRPRRAGRVPPFHRRYTPSPNRYYNPPQPFIAQEKWMINSSEQLLDKVGKEDGIMDLPAPAMRSVFITTYPFGEKDVKKWSWLFAAGIEDEYVVQSTRDMTGDVPAVVRARLPGEGYSANYDTDKYAIPPVLLSRALDKEVVPEDSKHNVRYLVVTENRCRPTGVRLLVAESRKAASILIFYNMVNGDPIMFVGATVHQCKAVHPRKYKKVDSLEEAVSIQDDGYVGVVC